MSVKNEAGRRSVEVEVEVPGTPEEVWRAIATGPGISSWFVPTEVEERVGGTTKASFGPGMDSIATVTEWDPPNRMAADSQDLGPDAPTIATEWIVEAREGGTCIVRVVHSLFTEADDWDNELNAWKSGWPDFFRILRLYLEHFAGQPSELVALSAMTPLEAPEAWSRVRHALEIGEVAQGSELSVDAPGLPTFRSHVEKAGGAPPHEQELLLRMMGEASGLAHWFALRMGEQTLLSFRFYLYGADVSDRAERWRSEGQSWLDALAPKLVG